MNHNKFEVKKQIIGPNKIALKNVGSKKFRAKKSRSQKILSPKIIIDKIGPNNVVPKIMLVKKEGRSKTFWSKKSKIKYKIRSKQMLGPTPFNSI